MSSSIWYTGATSPSKAEYLSDASELLKYAFDKEGVPLGPTWEHNKSRELNALSRKYPGIELHIRGRDEDGDQWREKYVNGRFYQAHTTTVWSKFVKQ